MLRSEKLRRYPLFLLQNLLYTWENLLQEALVSVNSAPWQEMQQVVMPSPGQDSRNWDTIHIALDYMFVVPFAQHSNVIDVNPASTIWWS